MMNKVQNLQIICVVLSLGCWVGVGAGGHSTDTEVELAFKSKSDAAHSYG